MSDLPPVHGTVIYHVDVPAEEIAAYKYADIAEAYVVETHAEANAGCIVWGKYNGEWHCNPWSTRWLVLHLLKRLEPATTEGGTE